MLSVRKYIDNQEKRRVFYYLLCYARTWKESSLGWWKGENEWKFGESMKVNCSGMHMLK